MSPTLAPAFLLALVLGLLAGIGAGVNKGFVWTDADDPRVEPPRIERLAEDRPVQP